jgi:ABC-type transport system substrate-binding protein
MQRRPLIKAAALAAVGVGAGSEAAPPAPPPATAAALRVLHLAIPSPETTLDPVQTNSDNNTSMLLSQILEAPLAFDYLARPTRLVLATAAAMPEVSADGRVFTVRIQPGIFFADDPAFKGKSRELVAQDYVYALKRFYDPRWNSSDLYLFESLKLPGLSELRQAA